MLSFNTYCWLYYHYQILNLEQTWQFHSSATSYLKSQGKTTASLNHKLPWIEHFATRHVVSQSQGYSGIANGHWKSARTVRTTHVLTSNQLNLDDWFFMGTLKSNFGWYPMVSLMACVWPSQHQSFDHTYEPGLKPEMSFDSRLRTNGFAITWMKIILME